MFSPLYYLFFLKLTFLDSQIIQIKNMDNNFFIILHLYCLVSIVCTTYIKYTRYAGVYSKLKCLQHISRSRISCSGKIYTSIKAIFFGFFLSRVVLLRWSFPSCLLLIEHIVLFITKINAGYTNIDSHIYTNIVLHIFLVHHNIAPVELSISWYQT